MGGAPGIEYLAPVGAVLQGCQVRQRPWGKTAGQNFGGLSFAPFHPANLPDSPKVPPCSLH